MHFRICSVGATWHNRLISVMTYFKRGTFGGPRAIDLPNTRKRGCNPSAVRSAHPIPRQAINNIPILDTIHLEINRQPIGKPGQIDFEIDNLWCSARKRVDSRTHSSKLAISVSYSAISLQLR